MSDDYSKIPYKNILAWRKGYEFVIEVYRTIKNFPIEERYGIVSQLRRAAVSVLANIVEGRAKRSVSEKEFLRFLSIAKGSLWECEFFLGLSRDLGYLNKDEFAFLEDLRSQTAYLLHEFMKKIKKDMGKSTVSDTNVASDASGASVA
ncbi:MAG: four helix bundle protein [Candidatus Uhrbacteria bacterium]